MLPPGWKKKLHHDYESYGSTTNKTGGKSRFSVTKSDEHMTQQSHGVIDKMINLFKRLIGKTNYERSGAVELTDLSHSPKKQLHQTGGQEFAGKESANAITQQSLADRRNVPSEMELTEPEKVISIGTTQQGSSVSALRDNISGGVAVSLQEKSEGGQEVTVEATESSKVPEKALPKGPVMSGPSEIPSSPVSKVIYDEPEDESEDEYIDKFIKNEIVLYGQVEITNERGEKVSVIQNMEEFKGKLSAEGRERLVKVVTEKILGFYILRYGEKMPAELESTTPEKLLRYLAKHPGHGPDEYGKSPAFDAAVQMFEKCGISLSVMQPLGDGRTFFYRGLRSNNEQFRLKCLELVCSSSFNDPVRAEFKAYMDEIKSSPKKSVLMQRMLKDISKLSIKTPVEELNLKFLMEGHIDVNSIKPTKEIIACLRKYKLVDEESLSSLEKKLPKK